MRINIQCNAFYANIPEKRPPAPEAVKLKAPAWREL